MGQLNKVPKSVIALGAMTLLMLGANGSMVWLSSRGHRDLVRPDYYDAGLDQDGIMARTNLSRLPGMEVTLLRDSSGWKVETGAAVLKKTKCNIRFYRPDNCEEDKTLDLGFSHSSLTDSSRIIWKAASPSFRRGYWVAHLVWEEGAKSIMEKSFRIYIEG